MNAFSTSDSKMSGESGSRSYDDSTDGGDNDLIEQIKSHYREGMDHTKRWRKEAVEDYAFVAGDQWDSEDKAQLQNQMRPCITFNRIGPIVDAVSGSEVSNRQEVRYIPREIGDAAVSEVLTAAGQWFRDECDAEDEESDAFLDTTICGMGWTETNLAHDDNPDGDGEVNRVDPLEMIWDPHARKRNLSDRAWDMRVKRMRKKDLVRMFPEAQEYVDDKQGVGWLDEDMGEAEPERVGTDYRDDKETGRKLNDKRVAVVEYTWIDYEDYVRVVDPTTGEEAEFAPEQFAVLEARFAAMGMPLNAAPAKRKVYMTAFACGNHILQEERALSQVGFKYQCITGKRDRNHGTWYGLVRAMKDPQRWANKWLSQILHIMNSNAKGGVMAETDAFEDERKAEEEWAQPDAITWAASGALANGKIQPKPQAAFPAGFAQLMGFAIDGITEASGVSKEFLGIREVNQPGVLEYQRKQAGLTVLATLFDSLRRYRKQQGRVMMDIIRNYLSDGRLIRIVGQTGQQYVPLLREDGVTDYDVIVDEASTAPNQKEKVFQILMQMMPQLASMNIMPPVDVLDYLPLPESLIQKWKQQLSQPQDPAMQQMKQLEMGQKQADIAKTQAEVKETETDAVLNLAQARKAQADAVRPPTQPVFAR